jgi:hypothetical protein
MVDSLYVHTHIVKFTCVQSVRGMNHGEPANNPGKVNPFLAIGVFVQ